MDSKERHLLFIECRDKIMEIVDKFQIITKEQIVAILRENSFFAGQVVVNLKSMNKIYEAKPGVYVNHKSLRDQLDRLSSYEKLLWLLIDLKDKIEYTDYAFLKDKNIIATIVRDTELIDVVVCRLGSEIPLNNIMKAKERYLPPEDLENLHRIVIIDDESQISKIKINGAERFVIIKDGSITYL